MKTGKIVVNDEVEAAENADQEAMEKEYNDIYDEYLENGAITLTVDHDETDVLREMCAAEEGIFTIIYDRASSVHEEGWKRRAENYSNVESVEMTVEENYRYVNGSRKQYHAITYHITYK